MKAVIVDLRNGQAAALCDDGRVIKLTDPGYSLGQIVEVHERRRRTPIWVRWASTAAAAALLLAGAGGGAAYAMPYGVVSLDVNPSLEYTINCFDYVLKVEGVNEDGKELLARMDTKQFVHHRIGDALEASVQQLEAVDWLGEESGEILISAGAKQPEHAERIVSALENDLRRTREGLEIHAFTVSEEDIDAAHREGMSAGRHHMLGELKSLEGADFVPAEWADRPIRDIFSRLESAPAVVSAEPETPNAQPETNSGKHAPEHPTAAAERENPDARVQEPALQDAPPRSEQRTDAQPEPPGEAFRPEPGGDQPRPADGFGGMAPHDMGGPHG